MPYLELSTDLAVKKKLMHSFDFNTFYTHK